MCVQGLLCSTKRVTWRLSEGSSSQKGRQPLLTEHSVYVEDGVRSQRHESTCQLTALGSNGPGEELWMGIRRGTVPCSPRGMQTKAGWCRGIGAGGREGWHQPHMGLGSGSLVPNSPWAPACLSNFVTLGFGDLVMGGGGR